MKKVAINGMGRIGRATLKVLLERSDVEVVAVNDLVSPENLAYLIQYDTVYGRFDKEVKNDQQNLIIDDKKYMVPGEKDPARLPWKDLEVDLVFECTGQFTRKAELQKHIQAGARHVILSAPSKSEEIATIVHGVNQDEGKEASIISCASCTTNCITPVVEIMSRRIGVEKANMTTIHAYTASQALIDMPHKKKRRGRAAAANFVPTTTGAALATTRALPDLKGKFDGAAIRGPVPVGSIADINFVTSRKTSVDEVQNIFSEESETDRYKGILGVSSDPLVSSDIIMDPRASVIDLPMIQVTDGDMVKVMSWYDNEWGYVNQMVREAESVLGID